MPPPYWTIRAFQICTSEPGLHSPNESAWHIVWVWGLVKESAKEVSWITISDWRIKPYNQIFTKTESYNNLIYLSLQGHEHWEQLPALTMLLISSTDVSQPHNISFWDGWTRKFCPSTPVISCSIAHSYLSQTSTERSVTKWAFYVIANHVRGKIKFCVSVFLFGGSQTISQLTRPQTMSHLPGGRGLQTMSHLTWSPPQTEWSYPPGQGDPTPFPRQGDPTTPGQSDPTTAGQGDPTSTPT